MESNFALELAFRQEQYSSCDNILSLCEQNRIDLILPAYSLVEPIETLHRRKNRRKELQQDLSAELKQITRSSTFTDQSDDLYRFPVFLTQSAQEDTENFELVRTRLLDSADVVSLDAKVLKDASNFEEEYGISRQDAIVYSSVISHLRQREIQQSYFLNRNSKDFDDINVLEQLSKFHCRLITQFDDGYRAIVNSLD